MTTMANSSRIKELNLATKSVKDVLEYKEKQLDSGNNFPSQLAEILDDVISRFLINIPRNGLPEIPLQTAPETKALFELLNLYKRLVEADSSLEEEASREGSHRSLSKIINFDSSRFEKESDQDVILDLQDIACEIAALSASFPVRIAPFTLEELRQRLPLSFWIPPAVPTLAESSASSSSEDECKTDSKPGISQDGFTILINQVKSRQSAQKDVGFVMWPSAVALARWLVSHPEEVRNKQILELGSGCGLTGLVAAKLVSRTGGFVTLTDFNEMVVKNAQQNITLNNLSDVAKSENLDFYQQDTSREGWMDAKGYEHEQVDLILAADVICQKEDAFAAARSIFCAMRTGGKAIVVSADSEHRFGVECFHQACEELGLLVTARDVREIHGGNLLSIDMDKTTGYVNGMKLTLYTVQKEDRCGKFGTC